MKIDKTGRETLKSYFVKNAVPTASNFEELIGAALNQRDDGIAKPPGEPLSLQADGDDSSQKKLLNFYRNFNDAKPAFGLALSPRSDPRNAQSGRPGLGFTDGDGNPRLFIDQATGQVGVGTVVPGAQLQVNGALRLVANHGVSPDPESRMQFSGQLQIKGNAPQIDFIDTEQGDWAIHVNNNRMYFIREPWYHADLVLDGKGNVGMGTPDPRAKLEIRDGALMVSPGNSAERGILFPPDPGGGGGDSAWIRYYPRVGEATTLEIGTSNDADDHIALMPGNGNVGVGTRAPRAKLDVAGAIYAGGSDIYFTETDHKHSAIGNQPGWAAIENARDYNALMILGRSTGAGPAPRRVAVWDHLQVFGQFINNSDVRAKHAIEPLHYGLADVMKLRPVSFRWNELEESHKTLGLIAQDVQAVIAEAVLPSDPSQPDSRLGLAYNSLVPVLIRAVQELSHQVDALRQAAVARPGTAAD
jgi:hypothetical protein